MPAKLTEDTAHPTSFAVSPNTGLMNPLGTCLSQEMSRFNLLLQQMSSTQADLRKAIKGLIVMTGDLDEMFQMMLNNQVPNLWVRGGIGYPCLKPLSSYFEDMLLRVKFFREWIEHGVPASFWISAFYFPQGFLTSVLQGYSRGNMIPVDQLSYDFILQGTSNPAEFTGPPEEGILIHGLFMDSAAWDYNEGVMCDQEPGVAYVPAPVINMIPFQDRVANPDKYCCPIYKTSVRAGTLSTTGHSTNFVLAIEVETAEDPSYWILKAAALLTMLNN